jgi:hypothetical protein
MFDELMSLVAGRFARVEPRRTARDMVLGLLSLAERKNCWWLAEQAGHGDPLAMQRLLRTASGTLMRSLMMCAGSSLPIWVPGAGC